MPTTVKYPVIKPVLRAKHTKEGPLVIEECKKFLGWLEEPKNENWGSLHVLKDTYGKKIRLQNVPKNRPFRKALADKYASEHLRKKWALNLETIVFDSNGNIPQGQHRLTGFILAEQQREVDPKQWGKSPLKFEVLLGFGVSPKPEVANSFDKGATRTLGDVLYRHEQFGKKTSDKEQRKIAKVLAASLRLVWLRSGGKQMSHAPHFPHSEALEFYERHPKILQSVQTIIELDNGEEGKECKISSLLGLGYAAGLHYLMAPEEKEKTLEFWSLFASGEGLRKGNPILSLRQLLIRLETGGSTRDEVIGTVIKTWHLWKSNKKGASKDIRVKRKREDGEGSKLILAETPYIGGLDRPMEETHPLSQHQLVILSVLRKVKKEITYKSLTEATGLQLGTLSKAIMNVNRQDQENPNSLATRGLVKVSQYEPEEGERIAPYWFQLTAKGQKRFA